MHKIVYKKREECALATLSKLLPVAWALNNLVPVGSSEVNGKGRRERDVRVHFALVTDEAALIRPTVGPTATVRTAASADVRG